MSVTEELHKTIDELSVEQQQELLETARLFLQAVAEKDNAEYQTLLKELLIKRYEITRLILKRVFQQRTLPVVFG